jgi:hypothetical protein
MFIIFEPPVTNIVLVQSIAGFSAVAISCNYACADGVNI